MPYWSALTCRFSGVSLTSECLRFRLWLLMIDLFVTDCAYYLRFRCTQVPLFTLVCLDDNCICSSCCNPFSVMEPLFTRSSLSVWFGVQERHQHVSISHSIEFSNHHWMLGGYGQRSVCVISLQDYLTQLHDLHEDWLLGSKKGCAGAPVMVCCHGCRSSLQLSVIFFLFYCVLINQRTWTV